MDKVCLLEDDPTISQLIGEKLRDRGYDVSLFDTADDLLVKWRELALAGTESPRRPWDLYILDILLPGETSGLDFCRILKGHSPETPVLLLSALSEPGHRVEGLKVGADDYLTKPFEMEELLLRVAGMLRRRSWYASHPKNNSLFEWDDNGVDFVSYEGHRGSDRFVLTQKECMLMKLLVEHENEVVSRDVILDQVWGYNAFPSTRTVDNFIVRLRKLFEKVPGEPKYIHSVRGMGYKFTASKPTAGTKK